MNKKLFYFFAIFIALLLLFWVFNTSSVVGKIGIGMLLGFWASIVLGFKVSQSSGSFIASRICELFISPKSYLREKPEMLSPIEGMILQRRFEEAEAQLLGILKRKPDTQEAVAMLGQLYLDNLRNYPAAEKVTADYMLRRKKIRPGDLQVVNLHVDACLEQRKKADAVACLECELKRIGHLPGDLNTLRIRLEALTR